MYWTMRLCIIDRAHRSGSFFVCTPETSVSGGTWDRLAISVADIYTAFGKSSFAGVAELLHAKAVERLWDQWVFVAIKRSDGSVMAYDPSATSTRLDSAAITKVYFAPVEDSGGVVTLDFSLIACNVVDCVVLSVGFRVTPTTPYLSSAPLQMTKVVSNGKGVFLDWTTYDEGHAGNSDIDHVFNALSCLGWSTTLQHHCMYDAFPNNTALVNRFIQASCLTCDLPCPTIIIALLLRLDGPLQP